MDNDISIDNIYSCNSLIPSDESNGRNGGNGRFSSGNRFARGGRRAGSGRKPLSARERLVKLQEKLNTLIPGVLHRIAHIAMGSDDRLSLQAGQILLQYALPTPKEPETPPQTQVNIQMNPMLKEARALFEREMKEDSVKILGEDEPKAITMANPVPHSNIVDEVKADSRTPSPQHNLQKQVNVAVAQPYISEPGRYLTASQLMEKQPRGAELPGRQYS